jgi:hypothetical protein
MSARPELAERMAAADLDRGQRDVLRALLATYLGRVLDAVSPMDAYASESALNVVARHRARHHGSTG